MTDRELKKQFKKLGILFIIIAIVIIILLKYTLASKKAEVSIYTNSESYNKLYALGINEKEFVQYLSVFGNLVNKDCSENQNLLNMATNFAQDMCSVYEVKIDENNLKVYDAQIINNIIKEVKATYIKKSLDTGDAYKYNEIDNAYVQNEIPEKIPYCIEIKDISKKSEKIEVTYKLAFMTSEQMAKYLTDQETQYEECDVKAVIMENQEYEYSKYFVSEIKKIGD